MSRQGSNASVKTGPEGSGRARGQRSQPQGLGARSGGTVMAGSDSH